MDSCSCLCEPLLGSNVLNRCHGVAHVCALRSTDLRAAGAQARRAMVAPMFPEVYSEVLAYTGDRFTFRSLRVLSATLYAEGERMRLVVDQKINDITRSAMPGWTDRFPPEYRKLMWWRPWRGCLRVPETFANPMFQAFWDHNNFSSRRIEIHGNGRPMRMVELWGCSDESIFFHVYLETTHQWHRWQEVYFFM